MKKGSFIYGVLALLILVGCGKKEGGLFLNPEGKDTGITFANSIAENNELNILDYLYFYNGGGVAIGDINNDGLPDIFFSGNQVKNKLYLNKGNLRFEDITDTAGVQGNSTWNTGAVMGDVNGDGLLDIYVCAVVGLNGFDGHNELYINGGDGSFTERSSEYGLDFDTYSSSAAFLDYDLDGDLDMYLLNHAVHTQESFGKAALRYKRNYQTGDKLLRNDGGKFTEVSEEAGIFGGINGYGLGVAVADFNQDGYPDIYVGNDFHEDDYYYLNNGDGTFTESLKQYFGHSTRFSMGNDVADINHDGMPDIISLDMLPEEEIPLKSSEGDDNVQTLKLRTQRYGYHYQFTRNMLHVNRSNGQFMETALLSGIAATDWSWSALFGDYDQDGEQDIFISNGIPRRPNDLDFIRFLSDEQIRKKINNTKLVDQQALDLMPSGSMHNYIFQGSKELRFTDKSNEWITRDTTISGATALGDLDNDGDLDVVTNNINGPAILYINKTNDKNNYLKIKFNYKKGNNLGIGTKVFSYHQGKLQYKELYTVRGFQASSEPVVHFGYGKADQVDSLKIIWPDKTYQLVKNITVNQTLILKPENTEPNPYASDTYIKEAIFEKTTTNLGIDFTHREDGYIDFNRQKLIPYQISDRGPATAIGDINNDGKEDILLGGSMRVPSKIYLQKDSSYIEQRILSIAKDSIKEDISAVIADFNDDHLNDIFIGTGGGNFRRRADALADSYYIQNDSTMEVSVLPEYSENISIVLPNDIDQDGDLDLFVGSNAVPSDFGNIPNSYLLKNNKGSFELSKNTALQQVGMVTDAIWSDFDDDGDKDLIVVGEWMSPTFFKNNKGSLSQVDVGNKNLNGLWQSIAPMDIDNDGDMDYVLGNWGMNTKFKASAKNPMKMFYGDLDTNGTTETIIALEKQGKYYAIHGLDELAGQLVSLRKKFTTYKDFAGKSIKEIFDKKMLSNAKVLEVSVLESGYLKNENGKFNFIPFADQMQIAPITSLLTYDFDGDSKKELLAAGNYFGVKPYHGRFDGFSGALIQDEKNVILGHEIGLDFFQKSVRHLNIITLKKQPYLLATINNDTIQVYKLPQKQIN
ncbi:MAG: CRTAC1 family protein [Bacteroidota bacterium]